MKAFDDRNYFGETNASTRVFTSRNPLKGFYSLKAIGSKYFLPLNRSITKPTLLLPRGKLASVIGFEIYPLSDYVSCPKHSSLSFPNKTISRCKAKEIYTMRLTLACSIFTNLDFLSAKWLKILSHVLSLDIGFDSHCALFDAQPRFSSSPIPLPSLPVCLCHHQIFFSRFRL